MTAKQQLVALTVKSLDSITKMISSSESNESIGGRIADTMEFAVAVNSTESLPTHPTTHPSLMTIRTSLKIRIQFSSIAVRFLPFHAPVDFPMDTPSTNPMAGMALS